jgi:hypothetical protein
MGWWLGATGGLVKFERLPSLGRNASRRPRLFGHLEERASPVFESLTLPPACRPARVFIDYGGQRGVESWSWTGAGAAEESLAGVGLTKDSGSNGTPAQPKHQLRFPHGPSTFNNPSSLLRQTHRATVTLLKYGKGRLAVLLESRNLIH